MTGRFLPSISAELLARAGRVRALIGDRHWLTDGHHKEELLRELLRQHLPSPIRVSRGFVLDPTGEVEPSREQDILLLNETSERPVFSTGDTVFTGASTVAAAVSVKSTLNTTTLRDVLAGLASVAAQAPGAPIPLYAFFFDQGDPESRRKTLTTVLSEWMTEVGLYTYRPDTGVVGPPLDGLVSTGGLVSRIEVISDAESQNVLRVRSFSSPDLWAALFVAWVAGSLGGRSGWLATVEQQDFGELQRCIFKAARRQDAREIQHHLAEIDFLRRKRSGESE